MKIISGAAGGVPLLTPPGRSARPTGSRARKALFDSISNFDQRIVLDLFAGCGSLGLEAASRGAKQVVFVDKNGRHCQIIEKNHTKIQSALEACQFRTIRGNALRAPKLLPDLSGKIDYIFADPPYADSIEFGRKMGGDAIFAEFAQNALLIWEYPDNQKSKESFFNTELWEEPVWRKFGQTDFILIKAKTL